MIGMLAARDRRRRGVGSALMAAAIAGARDTKFELEAEGGRPTQIRRANGELRDLIDMG